MMPEYGPISGRKGALDGICLGNKRLSRTTRTMTTKAKKAHPNLLIIMPHQLVLGQAVFSSLLPIRSTASPRADPKPLRDFFTGGPLPSNGKGGTRSDP
jgi:hypothetical protein